MYVGHFLCLSFLPWAVALSFIPFSSSFSRFFLFSVLFSSFSFFVSFFPLILLPLLPLFSSVCLSLFVSTHSALTELLYDGPEQYEEIKRFRKIVSEHPVFASFDDYFLSKEER